MRHYRLFLYIIFSITALFFIVGCSSDNNEDLIRTKIAIQAALPKGGISADGQPIKSFKTTGELSAYIRINKGPFYQMEMASDRAKFEIDNLQQNTYSFDIEFKYQTEEYGSVSLVKATKSVTITKAGGEVLLFDEDSYQYFDDDNDTASNYYELKLGTNPRDEDKIKPETIAFPAGGDSGGYWGQQTVVLSCSDLGASGCDKIYYTTDRSDPKTSPTRIEYDTSILIAEHTTLKFYSVDRAGNEEPTQIAEYIINNESIPPVTTLNPPPGTYNVNKKVEKECVDAGGSGCADMYYTVDGSDPKTSSTRIKYSTTISITEGLTILKFYSIDKAGNEEVTQTVEYIIDSFGGAALSRSIQTPVKPYIAAETYSANLEGIIASFSSVHPSGDFAYRIENNKVLGFRLKPATSTPIFELAIQQGIATSITLHPSGEFAYVTGYEQNDSWIALYNVDPQTGTWNKRVTQTHVPSFKAKIIAITPKGHYLYLISDERIISYNIAQETRQLTESLNQPIQLITPPSAALISQSGQLFYIRYQKADMVESYAVNTQTGALDGPIEQIPVNGTTTPKTMLILDQNLYLLDANSTAFRFN